MGPLLTAGITAGTSLIGGLFGKKNAEKAANQQFQYQSVLNNVAAAHQREFLHTQNREISALNDRVDRYNADILANHSFNESEDTFLSSGSIDFGRLVKDAEAAGFNPLTVLRSGGLAGYSTTNTLSTSRSKVARDTMTYFSPGETPMAPAPGNAPVVQATNPIGDALNAGVNAYLSHDKHAEERRRLEFGLAQAQLDNLNSDTAMNRRRLAIPTYTHPGTRQTRGGFAGQIAADRNGGLGAIATPKVGEVTVTNPHNNAIVDPTARDAQAYEDRYGEIAADLWGLATLAKDAWYNHSTNKASPSPVTKAGNAVMDYTDAAAAYLKQSYNNLIASWAQ